MKAKPSLSPLCPPFRTNPDPHSHFGPPTPGTPRASLSGRCRTDTLPDGAPYCRRNAPPFVQHRLPQGFVYLPQGQQRAVLLFLRQFQETLGQGFARISSFVRGVETMQAIHAG
jgi:hypothetical protein